ncbi:helix-turn-helix domain-containing protein [Nesterenkonia pannonica]|uniref:helix-turn-helix domain-containing protein n=1 Tax=Nesterenkonia pannonica TaxID=1548602 RepID=UPI0021645656|nr:helix-turn-helix domain-containing protein [Nesterenkonia pannonica]
MPDHAAERVSPVQSVDRAARILELLRAESGLTISEIARRLNVHRSTAFRLLATLEDHDLVEQEQAREASGSGSACCGWPGLSRGASIWRAMPSRAAMRRLVSSMKRSMRPSWTPVPP